MTNKLPIILTVLLMSALCGMEIDLFVPSFPDLQNTFDLSPFMAEWLLAANLIAYCLASLIIGNLADIYGRTHILLIGILIFIIGSLFCTFANNYWWIFFGRTLQGAGIAGPAVLSFLYIYDIYSTEDQIRMTGYFNGITTLAMAFAPVIGSYINLYFSWRGNFILLLLAGLLCLILGYICLPVKEIRKDASISVKEYLPIFGSKKLILYIVSICLFIQAYWSFIAIAPILYMQDLDVSLENFGLYQGTLAASFSIGSLLSPFFLKKYGTKNCFLFSLWLLVIFILFTFFLIIINCKEPLLLTLDASIMSVGIIIPCNVLWPLAMQVLPHAQSRTAAIGVAFKLITIAVGVQIVSYFHQGTFVPIGISMILVTIIAVLISYKLILNNDI